MLTYFNEVTFFISLLVIWGRTEAKCKQSAGVERQADRAAGGEPRHSGGHQVEADVDGNRYVTTYTRGHAQKHSHFLKIIISIRKHLSNNLTDFGVCFHVSESIFAYSEVSFHIMWC